MFAELVGNGAGNCVAQEWAEEIERQGGTGVTIYYYNLLLQGEGVKDRHAKSPLQYPLIGDASPHAMICGQWCCFGSDDFLALLDGPDYDGYDEAYANVLDRARFREPDGTWWSLTQGIGAPDLMLVQEGDNTFNEYI